METAWQHLTNWATGKDAGKPSTTRTGLQKPWKPLPGSILPTKPVPTPHHLMPSVPTCCSLCPALLTSAPVHPPALSSANPKRPGLLGRACTSHFPNAPSAKVSKDRMRCFSFRKGSLLSSRSLPICIFRDGFSDDFSEDSSVHCPP